MSDEKSTEVWWIKKGRGTLELKSRNKLLKENEKFKAYPHEIPNAWKTHIKCLEPDKLPENVPLESVSEFAIKPKKDEEIKESDVDLEGEEAESEEEYDIEERGRGWYDVINTASGKPINENALRIDDAEGLIEQLRA